MQGQPCAGGRFEKNGKTLLSGIDPVRRAEKIADSVSVTDRTLYFCPSPIYGYGLSHFLSRLETEAPNSAVLCIEADSELYDLSIKSIDSSLSSGKMLRITNICEDSKLYAFVRDTWGAMAFRRIETIRFTGGFQLFPQLYDSLCETLRREIATEWSNAIILAKLGRLYIRNFLRNIALTEKFPSVSNLSFGRTPVLVLGAGPSLDETLDALIRDFGGSHDKRPFKIVCVDTCLGLLKDRKIIPDLTVILESQHWNLGDFTGCRGWNVPAAIDLSSLPASAQVLCGQGFLFFTPWTNLRIFERLKKLKLLPAIIPPLGSVGLTAVELARRLTCANIICAGIDFSFTQDKYHARSTPGHRSKLNLQTRLQGFANTAAFSTGVFETVSKSGFSVKSSVVMRNYRNLFENEFGGDTRIFDIEGTGLPLGVKTLTMNEAMKMLKGDEIEFHAEKHRESNIECSENIFTFYKEERERLEELRNMLTGDKQMDRKRLNVLIDECDYLWAHFPDSARADYSDISFLKRMRAEIDPMLKLLKSQTVINHS
ncbi:MAG: DUF115 domain-containing protein [Treponema sp.]|nr:DUF115 domain-containing protein [Treponema sp.]